MARGKLWQSVLWANAKASARAILIGLGVEPRRLKNLDIETVKPEPVVLPKLEKRYRRSKEEMKQIKK